MDDNEALNAKQTQPAVHVGGPGVWTSSTNTNFVGLTVGPRESSYLPKKQTVSHVDKQDAKHEHYLEQNDGKFQQLMHK